MPWKVVGASVTGKTHEDERAPCQDAFAFAAEGERLVALVSDGAGSSAHASLGARHGVDTLAASLRELLATVRGAGPGRAEVAEAIARARDSLVRRVVELGTKLEDHHATLVGALAWPGGGLLLHIGDGAAVARHGDATTVSRPENGAFVEQTFFYTEDAWEQHLRVTPLPTAPDSVVLVTDGASTFALAPGATGLDPGFMDPVARHLARVDAEAGARALQATLGDPRTWAITGDDKTLLWALRLRSGQAMRHA